MERLHATGSRPLSAAQPRQDDSATRRVGIVPGTDSSCSVIHMNQNRRGGRPSKGDRADIKSRIPTDRRDKLYAYAELVGRPVTDLTAEVLVPWIDALDLEQVRLGEAQERLNVDKERKRTA